MEIIRLKSYFISPLGRDFRAGVPGVDFFAALQEIAVHQCERRPELLKNSRCALRIASRGED
jgi:hypothetical protein